MQTDSGSLIIQLSYKHWDPEKMWVLPGDVLDFYEDFYWERWILVVEQFCQPLQVYCFTVFCLLKSQHLEWRDFMKTCKSGLVNSFLGYITKRCNLCLTKGDLNSTQMLRNKKQKEKAQLPLFTLLFSRFFFFFNWTLGISSTTSHLNAFSWGCQSGFTGLALNVIKFFWCSLGKNLGQ